MRVPTISPESLMPWGDIDPLQPGTSNKIKANSFGCSPARIVVTSPVQRENSPSVKPIGMYVLLVIVMLHPYITATASDTILAHDDRAAVINGRDEVLGTAESECCSRAAR